jgi:hypothetical protein
LVDLPGVSVEETVFEPLTEAAEADGSGAETSES